MTKNIGKEKIRENVRIANIRFQSDICTEQDVKKQIRNGSEFVITKEVFESNLPFPSDCIGYLDDRMFYFNRKTMAIYEIKNFALLICSCLGYPTVIPKKELINEVTEIIELVENMSSEKDFSFIEFLPDGMRVEFIDLLIKKDIIPDNLYAFFMSTYISSDYGFDISKESLNKIIEHKTEEQKEITKSKLKKLPEIVTIYRGQTVAGTKIENAHSFSTNINIANFFATRRGQKDAKIIKAVVPRDKIIEVIDCRNEDEVFVNFEDIEITSEITLHGEKVLTNNLKKVAKDYDSFIDTLSKLDFKHLSFHHGLEHTIRVTLLTQLLANELSLSEEDKKILATAALYHDTQRENDNEDKKHGLNSMLYYESNSEDKNEIVSFLIKYHSLPDRKGERAIKFNESLSAQAERVTTLFNIFKDCDALDRVRFGIRHLDMNYLRLDVSKTYTLIAQLILERLKLEVSEEIAA